jgi:hypothetical protein
MHRKTVLAGHTLGIKIRIPGMAISRSRYRNHAFQVMMITGSRDRDHARGRDPADVGQFADGTLFASKYIEGKLECLPQFGGAVAHGTAGLREPTPRSVIIQRVKFICSMVQESRYRASVT